MPKVIVSTTLELKNSLTPSELYELVDEFEYYKSKWPNSEDMFYFFGKDSGYIFPQLTPPHQIKHVHLWPSLDSPESENWEAQWNRTEADKKPRRKTSNRVLVYAENKDRYLLIYILQEPDAHEIAQCKTKETTQLMEKFKQIAEEFIFKNSDLDGNLYP